MKKLNVLVLDMQPITPATGGGRLRLLGLYHGMGDDITVTYVGSYDWIGESARDHWVTPALREICVPLSEVHHRSAARLSERLGGGTVIDSAFSRQVRYSSEWTRVAIEHVKKADVVVFSHPWAYWPLRTKLRPEQLVVYDSHNVESLLKADLIGFDGAAGDLIREVVTNEYELCRRADLIAACSHADMDMYGRLFDVPRGKMRLVPNGAFTERSSTAIAQSRTEARAATSLDQTAPVALFIGSNYGPNIEAARFIARILAPAVPDVVFILVGGVGDVLRQEDLPPNVKLTGVVTDEERDTYLRAADLAVNPMTSGSGTNIKMFDFLAAGLPVVTTEIGARGICDRQSELPFVIVEELDAFPQSVLALVDSLRTRDALSVEAREFVRGNFSWEALSREFGHLLKTEHARHPKALFADTAKPKTWLFSTWNVKCGIAQCASYLAEALAQEGADLLVLGNRTDGHVAAGLVQEMRYPVVRLWTWDNHLWRDSSCDIETLRALLKEGPPEFAIVEHHSAFMPWRYYEQVLSAFREAGVRTAVEFHNSRMLSDSELDDFARAADVLFVHSSDESKRFSERFQTKILNLPLPIISTPKSATDDLKTDGRPVVGGFGFLRPYKGVLTTIRVVAELRSKWPDLRYRGWHSSYDSEAVAHLDECLSEAKCLGIEDAVEIDTAFHSIEEVMENLRRCDVVLLPYEPSEEGASAAANIAIAAARATVVSSSKIFQPVNPAVKAVAEHSVQAYAEAVDEVLSNQEYRRSLESSAADWAEKNSYRKAAEKVLGSLHDVRATEHQ